MSTFILFLLYQVEIQCVLHAFGNSLVETSHVLSAQLPLAVLVLCLVQLLLAFLCSKNFSGSPLPNLLEPAIYYSDFCFCLTLQHWVFMESDRGLVMYPLCPGVKFPELR